MIWCCNGRTPSVLAWGPNDKGQLGTGTLNTCLLPTPVDTSGALAGKAIMFGGVGEAHSLALCSDGTLVSWGYNLNGELGRGSTSTSNIPVLVTQSGVLAGKRVMQYRRGRLPQPRLVRRRIAGRMGRQ